MSDTRVAGPLVVVAATANTHKLAEMRAVFGERVRLLPRPQDLAEVVEDADTFVGNARLKATAVATHTGQIALADDSGLEVDALGGEPGVQSAYYGGADHDDAANRARLLSELAAVGAGIAAGAVAVEGSVGRGGRFRTVMVLRWPDGREIVAEGTCEGKIAVQERGSEGFGYDSLFVPDDGDGRTFGEQSADEKNALSHRGRACHALIATLTAPG